MSALTSCSNRKAASLSPASSLSRQCEMIFAASFSPMLVSVVSHNPRLGLGRLLFHCRNHRAPPAVGNTAASVEPAGASSLARKLYRSASRNSSSMFRGRNEKPTVRAVSDATSRACCVSRYGLSFTQNSTSISSSGVCDSHSSRSAAAIIRASSGNLLAQAAPPVGGLGNSHA